MDSESAAGGPALLALGIATFLGGLVLAVATLTLATPSSYAGVGARLFPGVASAGLILVGLWLAFQGWQTRHAPGTGEKVDVGAMAVMVGGLVAHMLLLERAGFVIASTVLFFAVTLAFRDRRWWLNLAIAFILALLTRVILGYGLGLSLPTLLPGWVI